MAVLDIIKPGILCLGASCSFFLGLLLSETSLVQTLESRLQEPLMAWRNSNGSTTDAIDAIVVVKLQESDLVGIKGEQAKYAALVKQLLDNDAAVVVLNLLDNWTTNFSDDLNPPLQQLVDTDHRSACFSHTNRTPNFSQPDRNSNLLPAVATPGGG